MRAQRPRNPLVYAIIKCFKTAISEFNPLLYDLKHLEGKKLEGF